MAPRADPTRVRRTLRLSTDPVFLAGPTASGKSAVALALADALGGEILAADSMQVYRGLDLGTAKPTASDRARVPHHLLDLVDPDVPFDAAVWLAEATRAVTEVRSRGRIPIFCGGTGLYFRIWFDGLEPGPPPDPERRARLEAAPLADLLAELQAGDPGTFARIDRQNPRRVVRAIERLRDRGPEIPTAPSDLPAARPSGAGAVLVLRRDPADLRRRIDDRVEAMFAAGLVDETRELLARGLARNRTAMQAIGYRQVVEHLEGGRDLAATVALVKTKTWQYARRQMTWFRHQLNAVWLDVPAGEAAETTARRLADGWRDPGSSG